MPPQATGFFVARVRSALFLALVEAQDQGVPVPQSRRFIAERFDVREAQIRAIEREGLENDWPPP
jgi:hypothetical protein